MNIACPIRPAAAIQERGMDRLVSQYRRLGAESFGANLTAQLKQAAIQLEQDPKWNARLTDLMAIALSEAAEEYRETGSAQASLERLNFLYTHGKAAQDLEDEWTLRMNALPKENLESTLTSDLERALVAAQNGRTNLVTRWVEHTEERILQVAASYESLSISTDEVTTESVLSHRLLLEGIEYWLEALALFQEGLEGGLDVEQVRSLAWQGQRRLKFVESLKAEEQQIQRRYFVHFN